MEAGLLTKRCDIQRSTDALDSSGSVVKAWQTIERRLMHIQPLRGQEYLAARQELGELTHKVRFRWSHKLSGLNARDRIRFGTRIFDIVAVRNLGERNREYELMCREVT